MIANEYTNGYNAALTGKMRRDNPHWAIRNREEGAAWSAWDAGYHDAVHGNLRAPR
jgi:hypothetical protein